MGLYFGRSPLKGVGLSGSNKWPKGHTRLQSLTQQHEGQWGNFPYSQRAKVKTRPEIVKSNYIKIVPILNIV